MIKCAIILFLAVASHEVNSLTNRINVYEIYANNHLDDRDSDEYAEANNVHNDINLGQVTELLQQLLRVKDQRMQTKEPKKRRQQVPNKALQDLLSYMLNTPSEEIESYENGHLKTDDGVQFVDETRSEPRHTHMLDNPVQHFFQKTHHVKQNDNVPVLRSDAGGNTLPPRNTHVYDEGIFKK